MAKDDDKAVRVAGSAGQPSLVTRLSSVICGDSHVAWGKKRFRWMGVLSEVMGVAPRSVRPSKWPGIRVWPYQVCAGSHDQRENSSHERSGNHWWLAVIGRLKAPARTVKRRITASRPDVLAQRCSRYGAPEL